MYLVVEGVDRNVVLAMLLAGSLAGGQKGAALLGELLMMSGVLSLARGDAPWIAKTSLLGLLGNDSEIEHRVERGSIDADPAKNPEIIMDARSALAALGTTIAAQAAPLSCHVTLLSVLREQDDAHLCQLPRKIDLATWTVVLHQGPTELYERVWRNLGIQAALDLTHQAVASPN